MSNAVIPLQETTTSPYLSIIAASRNDDHGGDPLVRTQIFINNIARQCEKYHLSAELLLVDWNPVPGRTGLAAVLDLPSDVTYFKARVVTVPSSLHQRLKYAEKLPLFQMIAKNVGIRRAQGRFVLATNIDIIFSDELVQFIAKQKLDTHKQYRVDRYDIHNKLTKDLSPDEILKYAWDNPIRTNRRYHPEQLVDDLYGKELFRRVCKPDKISDEKIEGVEIVNDDGFWQLRPECSVNMSHLHTNACGDFTLLSREGWETIRGYPEFAAYSFNIDSMGLIAAHYAGYEEVSLLPPCVCFHIEHGIGSGWTPEGEKKLFNRLREAEILSPEWSVLTPLVDEMREKEASLEFNHAGWGMADFDLPEQALGDTDDIPSEKLDQLALQAKCREISAIQPAYDLDRLTLMHERHVAYEQRMGWAPTQTSERVVVYLPDSSGNYFEENTMVCFLEIQQITTLVFSLEKFVPQFPLRLDPCQLPGLISIRSITAFEPLRKKVVWKANDQVVRKLAVQGTASSVAPSSLKVNGWKHKLLRANKADFQKSQHIISTGNDPQLILPLLPDKTEFPLEISIEMSFIPFR